MARPNAAFYSHRLAAQNFLTIPLLAALAPSLREAFIMKHVEGRSYEEMAELLDTTVGALKMRVHRAREALQHLLEEKYA